MLLSSHIAFHFWTCDIIIAFLLVWPFRIRNKYCIFPGTEIQKKLSQMRWVETIWHCRMSWQSIRKYYVLSLAAGHFCVSSEWNQAVFSMQKLRTSVQSPPFPCSHNCFCAKIDCDSMTLTEIKMESLQKRADALFSHSVIMSPLPKKKPKAMM